jgi:hypothetical protein
MPDDAGEIFFRIERDSRAVKVKVNLNEENDPMKSLSELWTS